MNKVLSLDNTSNNPFIVRDLIQLYVAGKWNMLQRGNKNIVTSHVPAAEELETVSREI